MRTGILPAIVLLIAQVATSTAIAAEGVHLFVSPDIGYTKFHFKAIQIEKSFITSTNGDDTLDETDVGRPVGEKSIYDGTGVRLGVTGGLQFASLRTGFRYDWAPIQLDGYWKTYRYDALLGRAKGDKYKQSEKGGVSRVLLDVAYGLPIGIVELELSTRLGALFLDDGGLPVGKAAESGRAFTGDLGLGLNVSLLSWLRLGVEGNFGFFAFDGIYEGAYGTMTGFSFSALVLI